MTGTPLDLLIRTFPIGLAVAMPVGAMAVLCAERTLERGWLAGMATGLGIATADGIYASVAAFGVTAISATLIAWQTPLRVVGGLALVLLGLNSVRRAHGPQPAKAERRADTVTNPWAMYLSAVALTLTNPMTIMAFGAVFVSAGLTGLNDAASALAATLGVALGSLTWWLVLTTSVSAMRHGFRPSVSLWLTRLSGTAIALFGAAAAGSVLLK